MNTVRVNDFEMAVDDRGSGPVLLLVHGFPLDHRMWQPQLDELSDAFRVIAPDLRGFGKSGGAPDSSDATGVTMERMADDLASLLDALGITEPIAYCGLSMGGYIGWQFYRKYAQRLRAFILCDTRAAADNAEAAANRRKMAEHVLEKGTRVVSEAMLPKMFADSSHRERTQVVDYVRGVIAGTDPRAIVAAQRGMAVRPDATGMLPSISVPTLVIVGEHDAISPPKEMRAIADAIPQAEFVEISDAGHMAPLERPEAVNPVLGQFLRSI